VVAIDGEIIASPNFANILLDLAVLRSLSIKVIIVHGASAQIAQLAAGARAHALECGRHRCHRRSHAEDRGSKPQRIFSTK